VTGAGRAFAVTGSAPLFPFPTSHSPRPMTDAEFYAAALAHLAELVRLVRLIQQAAVAVAWSAGAILGVMIVKLCIHAKNQRYPFALLVAAGGLVAAPLRRRSRVEAANTGCTAMPSATLNSYTSTFGNFPGATASIFFSAATRVVCNV
jgi:hypothetical protein